MIDKIEFPKQKKELFSEVYLTQKKWEFQEGVGTPHLVLIPVYGIVYGLKLFYKDVNVKSCLTATLDGGSSMYWIWETTNVLDRNHMIDDDSIENIHNIWQSYKEKFYQAMDNFNFDTPLSDYEKYFQIYYKAYSPALVTEWFTSIFSDQVISDINNQKPEYKDQANVLVKNPKLAFLQREKFDLLKLSLTKYTLQDVAKHRQKWHFANYNYRDTNMPTIESYKIRLDKINKLSENEIKNQIEKLKNYENEHQKQVNKIKDDKIFTSQEFNRLLKIGFVGLMQDERKELNLIGNWMVNEFLKKASKEYDIDFGLLQYCTPAEFVELTNTGKIDIKELKSRYSAVITVYRDDNSEEIISGNKAKEKITLLGKLRKIENIHLLQGTCASPGQVRGKVRIVTDPSKEGREFKKGEILVTSMTRPDMVPIMHKAAAVVTNEGGLTSHAAIISRELNIPCIVGTKIATKVIRDGDLVEVDAERGIVKIIERSAERSRKANTGIIRNK